MAISFACKANRPSVIGFFVQDLSLVEELLLPFLNFSEVYEGVLALLKNDHEGLLEGTMAKVILDYLKKEIAETKDFSKHKVSLY